MGARDPISAAAKAPRARTRRRLDAWRHAVRADAGGHRLRRYIPRSHRALACSRNSPFPAPGVTTTQRQERLQLEARQRRELAGERGRMPIDQCHGRGRRKGRARLRPRRGRSHDARGRAIAARLAMGRARAPRACRRRRSSMLAPPRRPTRGSTLSWSARATSTARTTHARRGVRRQAGLRDASSTTPATRCAAPPFNCWSPASRSAHLDPSTIPHRRHRHRSEGHGRIGRRDGARGNSRRRSSGRRVPACRTRRTSTSQRPRSAIAMSMTQQADQFAHPAVVYVLAPDGAVHTVLSPFALHHDRRSARSRRGALCLATADLYPASRRPLLRLRSADRRLFAAHWPFCSSWRGG